MGSLNRLFGSTELIAKNAEKDKEVILKDWKEYLSTIPKKEEIINGLPYSYGQRRALLQRLNQLLDLELVDIHKVEKVEDDLVSNLQSLEHSKKIRRVHRLEDCLRYFETRHEYVYELLRHLYTVLKSEVRLVEKLTNNKDLRKFRKLVSHLKSELIVEKTLIEKIKDINTFIDIFSALVKGEHVIHRMDLKERKLIRRMQKDINKIFSGKINKGITSEWVKTVLDAIENKFRELEAKEILVLHPDVHFELVNRQEFVVLVRETIKRLRKKDISEQMINVFVHIFREWYNHGLD